MPLPEQVKIAKTGVFSGPTLYAEISKACSSPCWTPRSSFQSSRSGTVTEPPARPDNETWTAAR